MCCWSASFPTSSSQGPPGTKHHVRVYCCFPFFAQLELLILQWAARQLFPLWRLASHVSNVRCGWLKFRTLSFPVSSLSIWKYQYTELSGKTNAWVVLESQNKIWKLHHMNDLETVSVIWPGPFLAQDYSASFQSLKVAVVNLISVSLRLTPPYISF